MACPGSIRLSREVPPAPDSPFAIEGTRAHSLAQLSLEKGVEPDFFVGIEIEGVEITEEMADYVKVFTDYCRTLGEGMIYDGDVKFWIERKFNLAKLNPPGPMYGTADFVAYNHQTRTLHVVDLKYGQGVVVEARGNKQLRYYALGAWLSLEDQFPVESVRMTIVQPRASHPDGVIRSEEILVDELVEYADDLVTAARATLAPDAPLNPGDHCRFCPASGICPAQRSRALAVAQTEFDVIVEDNPSLPQPEAIPVEQLALVLEKLPILEDWAAAVRGRAQAMLERGQEVPGFKLVAKRANRKWVETARDTVVAVLTNVGVDEGDLYKPSELKSPAQMEKVVGKKKFTELTSGLVSKQSSGYNMVPASDPRPAVNLSAGEEFTLIPANAGGGIPEGPETKE